MSILSILLTCLLASVLTDIFQRAGADRDNITIFPVGRRITDSALCAFGGIVALLCAVPQAVGAPQDQVVMTAAFGAFLARAALSDARVAAIPDEILAPLLVLAPIWKWIAVTGESPTAIPALLMAAAGLAAYLGGFWAFMRWERFRMTPPDFVLILVFVLVPPMPFGHLAGALAVAVFYCAVKARPSIAFAMMSGEERARMIEDAGAVGDEDTAHLWIPLYMFCVPAIFLAMIAGRLFG